MSHDPPEEGGSGRADQLERTVELVRLAQRGSERALGELVERYLPRVRTVVRARLGHGLRRELESGDVVQETLIEVLVNLDRFEQRDEGSFVRWIAAIVENRLRQDARFFRAQRRDRARELALDSGPEGGRRARFEPAVEGEGPASSAERREQLERLRAARAGLSERHRAVLEQREAGASWDAVAAALALASPDAARMLHARAKAALVRALMGEGGRP